MTLRGAHVLLALLVPALTRCHRRTGEERSATVSKDLQYLLSETGADTGKVKYRYKFPRQAYALIPADSARIEAVLTKLGLRRTGPLIKIDTDSIPNCTGDTATDFVLRDHSMGPITLPDTRVIKDLSGFLSQDHTSLCLVIYYASTP